MEGCVGIDPKLLEILACPVCKTPVKLEENGEALFCTQCRRLYPIRDDIPVMLVEEARIKEDK
ncbi:MAG: Trm112 family protein [Acidobacteria bacterium]|nr:MAG: Trm112 family protein [Acidobacteriota bacterium]TDI42780.1 MAG: Trm112 family protein [Acidobacteriota bacterium]